MGVALDDNAQNVCIMREGEMADRYKMDHVTKSTWVVAFRLGEELRR